MASMTSEVALRSRGSRERGERGDVGGSSDGAVGDWSGLPPGPAAPAIVQSSWLSTRPFAFLRRCARRYGRCFTVRVVGKPPLVVFSDPEAIREIFSGDPQQLHAGKSNRHLVPFVGPRSLLVLDGERHLEERRIVLPALHGDRMQAYGRVMLEIVDRAIDAWPLGRRFRLHERMQEIALEVILRTVFGLADDAQLARLRYRLGRMLARGNSLWAPLVMMFPSLHRDLGPLSPWGFFVRQMREVDAVLFGEIAARRAGATRAGDDVLALLLEARRADGAPLTAAELRDELFTLLMTGHETTATSLAWAFDWLLSDAEVAAKVRAEVRDVAGDAPIEPHHVRDLVYLDAVLKETARLTPIFWSVYRWLETPARIGGHDLPAGVLAVPCVYLAHHSPQHWPDPDRFDPGRFLGTRPSPYAFFPFGGGVRRCIGAAFATYEMKLVIGRVAQRVVLRRAAGARARPIGRNVTVAPSDGVPVIAENRFYSSSQYVGRQ